MISVSEITSNHLLEVIGRIEKRNSLSVAEKVRTWLKQFFDYAMAVIPAMETNPATDLRVVAVAIPPVEHNPFLRMAELPGFLQTLRKYPGRLAGYGIIRPCRTRFKVGPLYADRSDRAEALFLALRSRPAPSAPVFLDVPEVNSEAVALAERFGMTVSFETAWMYTRDEPGLLLQRLFGVTSFEIG